MFKFSKVFFMIVVISTQSLLVSAFDANEKNLGDPYCNDPAIDLRTVAVGFRCQSPLSKNGIGSFGGGIFKRVKHAKFGEAWKDLSSGLIWSDIKKNTKWTDTTGHMVTYYDQHGNYSISQWTEARAFCASLGGRVPNGKEFKRSFKDGFLGVLPNLKVYDLKILLLVFHY